MAKATIRIYINNDYSATQLFKQLVDCLGGYPTQAFAHWHGLFFTGDHTNDVVAEHDAKLAVNEVLTSAETHKEKARFYSASSWFSYIDDQGETHYLDMSVNCWAQSHAIGTSGFGRDMDGVAEITLSTIAPFMDNETNRHREDNTEKLIDLCLYLANTITPDSLKLFTNDEGLSYPFNAFLAYYPTTASVLNDSALIRRCVEKNNGHDNLPTIETYDEQQHARHFHQWRDAHSRRELCTQLSALVHNKHRATSAQVQALLDSEVFDVYEGDNGFVLLNYPDIFASLLGDFYMALFNNG